jgi:hypothetical protein
MYTENTDVSNGKASGTLCFLVKICLKNGVTEDDFELININGFWVRTIGASKVDYLLCQFAGSKKQFKISAQTNQCSINMPIELIPGMKTRHSVSAHINHFPVLTESCNDRSQIERPNKGERTYQRVVLWEKLAICCTIMGEALKRIISSR